MLDAINLAAFRDIRTQVALYEFSGITRYAPAGDRWTSLLSRLSFEIKRGGGSSLAVAIDCHLAETLIRAGACEDGLEILADLEKPLSGLMLRTTAGREARVPEYEAALLARARALTLLGRDREAEAAYRSLADESRELRSESLARLADLLVQNDRLQEALDLAGNGESDDARLAAHARSIAAMVYSRLNRQEISLAAANQALGLLEGAGEKSSLASQFRKQVTLGREKLEQIFVPGEFESRIHLNLIDSGLLRREAPQQHAQSLERILDWAHSFGDRSTEARCLRLQGEIALTAGDSNTAIANLNQAFECEMVPSVSREWKSRDVGQDTYDPAEIRREQWRKARLEAGVGMTSLLLLARAKIADGADALDELDTAIWGHAGETGDSSFITHSRRRVAA